MAHSKSEGGKGSFFDDPTADYLRQEAEDRAKVLAVLHELVGDPERSFHVDYISIRTKLPREAVLAVIGTLHNFRQELNYFDNEEVVRYDPRPEPAEKLRWYQSGCAQQNTPRRIQPQDGAEERWGDDVVFPDLPESPVSPMFTIDSS